MGLLNEASQAAARDSLGGLTRVLNGGLGQGGVIGLRTLVGSDLGGTVMTTYQTTPFDNMGGTFVWNPTSVAADNGTTIIAPNVGPATGRWVILGVDTSGGIFTSLVVNPGPTTLNGNTAINQGTITAGGTPALAVTSTWNNAAVTFPGVIQVNVTSTASHSGSLLMDLQVGGTSAFNVDKAGDVNFTGFLQNGPGNFFVNATTGNLSSGAHIIQPTPTVGGPGQVALNVFGSFGSNMTASTEQADTNFQFTGVYSWATGNFATQRFFQIGQPTLSFAGASTVTTAATVAILGAPVAGANATLTNSYALWVQAGISQFQAVQATSFTVSGLSANDVVYTTAGGALATSSTFTFAPANGAALAPSAVATGTQSAWTVTTAANTGQTSGTEVNGVNYNLSATRTWVTGAITTQREFLIQAPTYAFVAGSTVTTAATVAITGAPIAGANATITTPYALWVQSGESDFDSGSAAPALRLTTVASTATLALVDAGANGCNIKISNGSTFKYIRQSSVNTLDFINSAYTTVLTSMSDNGNWTITPTTNTSGALTVLSLATVANTGQTASTEVPGVKFNCSATRTWATGAIATQREVLIQAPTYAFAGASTITTAATVGISGAPIAGTNATLTSSYALWVQSGQTELDQGTITAAAPALAVTSTWNAGGVTFQGLVVNITNTASAAASKMLDVQVAGATYFGYTRAVASVAYPTFRSDGANLVINSGNASTLFLNTDTGTTTTCNGTLNVTPNTKSSGAISALIVTTAANTGQTASTEVNGINFNTSATRTWATGNIGTQREIIFQAPTYAFNGASTVTSAATVAITGAPIAGANATLSNQFALWVQANYANFAGGVIMSGGTNLINSSCLFGDGQNIQAGTVTGTQIATTTAQKIGFWGATPITQKNGYGTPTANTQTTNFPGTGATLAQVGGQMSQLLLDLKAAGIIGA